MDKYILVTNYEPVENENFYLSDEWGQSNYGRLDEVKEARESQNKNQLYYGYIVKAVDFAIYWQMDAQEVFINGDRDVIVQCESSFIDTEFSHKEEYEY